LAGYTQKEVILALKNKVPVWVNPADIAESERLFDALDLNYLSRRQRWLWLVRTAAKANGVKLA